MGHFFLDLYDVDNAFLSDEKLIKKMADKIVDLFGKGKITLIPYFNGKQEMDGGISCVIIADNFHFTCHTFSFKNTVFIDCFGDNDKKEILLRTILKYFPTENYDLCIEKNGQGNFGKHIYIYIYIVDEANADWSYTFCLDLVERIVKEIKMTKIADIITNFKDEKNFDILQAIAESHISLHRLNEKIVIDVFSCKNFDEQRVLKLVGASFKNTFIVSRGIHYK